jgi:hypothetical protein
MKAVFDFFGVASRRVALFLLPVMVGITTTFLMNYSNSPDLKLLIMDPQITGDNIYEAIVALENRGAAVGFSRIHLYAGIDESNKGALKIYEFPDYVKKVDGKIKVKEWEIDYRDDARDNTKPNTVIDYPRDVNEMIFTGRPTKFWKVSFDLSKVDSVKMRYSIIAESMAERTGGYEVFKENGKPSLRFLGQKKIYKTNSLSLFGNLMNCISGKGLR